jgi:hypothetical protein
MLRADWHRWLLMQQRQYLLAGQPVLAELHIRS